MAVRSFQSDAFKQRKSESNNHGNVLLHRCHAPLWGGGAPANRASDGVGRYLAVEARYFSMLARDIWLIWAPPSDERVGSVRPPRPDDTSKTGRVRLTRPFFVSCAI